MIRRAEIARAHNLVSPFIRRTPVAMIEAGVFADTGVTLKLELLQHTGSFKPRGAFANLLKGTVPEAGIAAASGGNHGAAVAHAARALGHAAHIFVPEIASPVKVEIIRSLGASVVVGGATYAEALKACEVHVAATGARPVHAYDSAETLTGQGTLGKEIDEDVGAFDTLLVAVGGGGLIGGIASWFAGQVRIVAVESEGTPTLNAALAADRPVDVAVSGIAADSLGAQRLGVLAFAAVKAHVEHSLLISDQAIKSAQRKLWDEVRLIAEPGGATALAALTSGAYVPERGERVVVILCGGNADPASVV